MLELKDYIMIATAVVTVASILVKLTPSTWDDTLVAKVLEFLALNKK